MKITKIISLATLAVLTILLSYTASAQTRQTTGTTSNLYNVDCVSNLKCYAVGSGGTILKTENGGETWETLISRVTYNLFGIKFLNENIGIAVGSSDQVLRTVDGGETWNTAEGDDENLSFWDVDFVGAEYPNAANTGIAVGNYERIIKTIDAGASWTRVRIGTSSAAAENLLAVKFVIPNIVIATGGDGIILKSIDGGETWVEKSSELMATGHSIDFLDENIGFIGGTNGKLLKTTDGGETWSLFAQLSPLVTIRGLHFIDSLHGWADGNSGTLWKTADGGETWTQISAGTFEILRGSDFIENEGWIAGDTGIILKIEDTIIAVSEADDEADDEEDEDIAEDDDSDEELTGGALEAIDDEEEDEEDDNGSAEIIFSDINEYKYETSIDYVKENGIVKGYDDGTYKPEKLINRAEFTKIVIEALYDNQEISEHAPDNCFPDISAGEWYEVYICLAKEKMIINGYPDNTFKPAGMINYVEALKIILEAYKNKELLEIEDVNENGHWYSKYVKFAEFYSLSLANAVKYTDYMTRGEIAEMIYWVDHR